METTAKKMFNAGFRFCLESGKHGGTFFYTEEQREQAVQKECSIGRIEGVAFCEGFGYESHFEHFKNRPCEALYG